MSIHPSRLLPAVPVLVAGLLVALLVAPVSAHGGAGELTVVGVEPAGAGQLQVTVDARYVNDGHPAEVRSLVIDGTGPGGAVLDPHEPFRPTDEEGRYQGVVAFPAPGSWTVVLTSTFPPARVEAVVEVPAPDEPAPDEPAPGGDGDEPGVAPGEPVDSTVDESGATADLTAVAGDVEGVVGDADDGTSVPWIALLGLGAIVAVGVGVVVARRAAGA